MNSTNDAPWSFKGDESDVPEGKLSHDVNFRGHIETGFQLATLQGPLCAEPVEGLAYFLENLDIDKEGIDREIC